MKIIDDLTNTLNPQTLIAKVKELITNSNSAVYTVNDVAADENGNVAVNVPVTSVNEQTGDVVIDDYVTGMTVSGKVITYTKKDGTSGKITTQDTNDTAYKLPCATCSTGSTTAAKVATITNSVSFSLVAGATINVKFSNGLSSGNIYNNFDISTLNVNSTGAKTVKLRYTKSTDDVPPFHNNNTYQFMYDGTYWNEVSGLTQKYNTAAGN